MSLQGNKAIMRRYFEDVLNGGNLDAIDELFAPTFAFYDPAAPGGVVRDASGLRQLIQGTRAVVPDVHFTVEEMIAEGDKVAGCWVARGTLQRSVLDIPVTGTPVSVPNVGIFRIAHDRIEEVRIVVDTHGITRDPGNSPASDWTRP